MGLSSLSVALLLIALAGWWWLLDRDPEEEAGTEPRSRRSQRNVVRAALVLAVLATHLNLFDASPGGGLKVTLPRAHMHESFHHYLGTRYFEELGYSGLYHAVALADYEDDRDAYDPRERIRDLATNQVILRTQAIHGADEIRAAFSDERWQAFKHDVGLHRARIEPDRWKLAVLDHGYNGTPVVTALLGGVAHQPWLSSERFLNVAPWLDLGLIVLLCGFVAIRERSGLGLAILFYVLANPLNDFSFVGASYLRYGYFLFLAGALFALRRGRLAMSGVLFALSGWMRLFPVALYGFVLLRDVASSRWRERLGEGRRLHIAFAIASLLIFAGTSIQVTPDGGNPWLGFVDNMQTHVGTSGINQVYAATPLLYSPARDRLHPRDGIGRAPENVSWQGETRRVREARAWLIRGVGVLLLGVSLLCLRHASRAAAVIPGLLAVFAILPTTHYYWSVLSLLPLALPGELRLQRGLLLLFAALGLVSSQALLTDHLDLGYSLMSVAVLAFLLWSCWTLPESPARPRGGAA